MKTIVLSFLCFISFFSCSDDENKPQENSIIGSWKLVEIYGSDGTDAHWTPIENGYTYSFTGSNTLISNRFQCNGTYSNQTDSITINFDCPENQFNGTYGISFENDNLILSSDPLDCDEGCAEKYKRVASE